MLDIFLESIMKTGIMKFIETQNIWDNPGTYILVQ